MMERGSKGVHGIASKLCRKSRSCTWNANETDGGGCSCKLKSKRCAIQSIHD